MPGGVCAVLDYEVEMMAEYVAEMAIRVVTPEAPVTTAFRKFVSQVLTSTRLPSTTILLGMNYLAKRINTLKSHGPFNASEGQVWRYLTVALLLGSKFLDDNTFQNKSWSDVSGIAVSELNTLEREWVVSMNWRLYVNLDTQKDYHAWLDSWRQWQQIKKTQVINPPSQERLPLQPIETDLPRLNTKTPTYSNYLTSHPTPSMEYDLFPVKRRDQQTYRGSDSAAWAGNWQANPITPPDSGYGTPDYALSATTVNSRYNEWFAAQIPYSRYLQPTNQTSFYPSHPPAHYQPAVYSMGPSIHGHTDCNCHMCANSVKQPSYYSSGYGTVMG